ncbi:LytTR family DNA-binding domain-containing protein [uncultured Croceitalea sp.]|uniref:LytR/AlgR family response regulator transcription factor n=1 Tax=uncultured Croceitalea sp. TaxID=1798908 RepID=UPI0033066E48
MKCILIDDEPIAHNIIEDYVKEIEGLEILKSFYNAIDAATYINEHKVDIIFLDIKMPKLKGLDFVKTIKNLPSIVVTTAYSEYALESFELPITDYLLKPFTFQRFFKAYTKVLGSRNRDESSLNNQEGLSGISKSIFLKGDKEIHQVKLSDICYLESYGGYVKIFLNNETYLLIHRALHFFETNLDNNFIRIHRSFIVNKDYIISIVGNRINLEIKKLPIGQTYKKILRELYE